MKGIAALLFVLIAVGCDDRQRSVDPADDRASEPAAGTQPAAEPALAEPSGDPAADLAPTTATEPTPADPVETAAVTQPSYVPAMMSAEEIPAALSTAKLALKGEPASVDAEKALMIYASVLAVDEGNSKAEQGIANAESALLQLGEQAMTDNDLTEAARINDVLQRQLPNPTAQSEEFGARVEAAMQVQALLLEAEQLVASGRRLFPDDRNAVLAYRDALAIAPENEAALAGLDGIVAAILSEATAAAEAGDYAQAEQLLAEATLVGSNTDAVQNGATRIVELRQLKAAQLVEQINSQIVNRNLDGAAALLVELENVSAQAEGVDDLRIRIENARIYGGLRPGQVIRDLMASGATSPALVVIPVGEFTMGSPNNEQDRKNNEAPQREVAVSSAFAMSRHEVTVGEFRAFVEASGYRPSSASHSGSTVYDEKSGSMAERNGVTWEQDYVGRRATDDLPVVHVSWDDAAAYAAWMSDQTGKNYRLPSEAEFEYVLRDGSQDRYPWGDGQPMRVIGNVTGDGDRSGSKRNWVNSFRNYSDGHWGPAPIGTFDANGFGVHDTVGNVSEWVEDCWHDSYQRAPNNSRAWVNPGCARRVIRGSGWSSAPDQVRSAFRINAEPSSTSARVGFRVVRGLD